MARWAIIDPVTHEVETVIVADASFIAAQFPGKIAVRHALHDRPDPEAAIVNGVCETGSGWDADTQTFVRPERGKRWDRAQKRMVLDTMRERKDPDEVLEDRIERLADRRVLAILRQRGLIPPE